MLKFLIVIAVVLAVLWLLRSAARGRARDAAKPSGRPSAEAGTEAAVMLECAHCGVHVPRADARFDAAGRPFCSDAHRLAGPR